MEIKAWQRVRITVVMAIAFTAEHAEAMLLGAMYLAIGRSLDIGASKLGTLSMWRALVQVPSQAPSCSTLADVSTRADDSTLAADHTGFSHTGIDLHSTERGQAGRM